VDASGAVWASFAYYNGGYNAIGDGVYFSTDNCNSWTSKNISGPTFRQIDPVGKGDTAYGVSYYDGIFVLTKTSTGGINTVSNPGSENMLKVYPNPSYDYLHVLLDKTTNTSGEGKIEIFDIDGNKLSETNMPGNYLTIDIHRLAAGNYFARYTGTGMIFTARFIRN
jgi:hypothetical protein